MFSKVISKRTFSSLTNYTSAANQRVFLTVAQGDQRLGDLVFELYSERQPATTESFRQLCEGSEEGGYTGTTFHQGTSGLGITGGKLGEENVSAFGSRLSDEDMTVRHIKRGQLTAVNDGPNSAGSEFTITFGATNFLDGYQTVFGELVEGQNVLDALEAGCDRHGAVKEDFTIVGSGLK